MSMKSARQLDRADMARFILRNTELQEWRELSSESKRKILIKRPKAFAK
jgi:hypothetical protein